MSSALVLSFFSPPLTRSLCICLSRAVDAWEKDISVHPLILPRSTCEELLKLLSSSTTILPSSLCSMNYYQVRVTLLGRQKFYQHTFSHYYTQCSAFSVVLVHVGCLHAKYYTM